MGTHFPSQTPHDTGHTQAVLYGGGGGVKIGDTFPNPCAP